MHCPTKILPVCNQRHLLISWVNKLWLWTKWLKTCEQKTFLTFNIRVWFEKKTYLGECFTIRTRTTHIEDNLNRTCSLVQFSIFKTFFVILLVSNPYLYSFTNLLFLYQNIHSAQKLNICHRGRGLFRKSWLIWFSL